MSDVLSAPELWVLSYAVEAKMPLCVFGAANFGEILGCNDASFTLAEVTDAIRCLFDRGMIAMGQRSRSAGMVEESSHGDLHAKFAEPFPGASSYLWLTSRGGAAWERYVQPDWSLRIIEDTDEAGRIVAIVAKHEQLLVRYVDAMREALGEERLRTSAEPVGSWAATYWKTLVGGTRVTLAAPIDPLRFDAGSNGHAAMRRLEVRWREVGCP